jgi:hypothetical protein
MHPKGMLKTNTETGEGRELCPRRHPTVPLEPHAQQGCSFIFHSLHKTSGAIELANPSDRAKHKNVRAVPEWFSAWWLAPVVAAAVDRWTEWWLLSLLLAEATEAPLLWMKMFFEAVLALDLLAEAFDALELFAEAVDALELLAEAVDALELFAEAVDAVELFSETVETLVSAAPVVLDVLSIVITSQSQSFLFTLYQP